MSILVFSPNGSGKPSPVSLQHSFANARDDCHDESPGRPCFLRNRIPLGASPLMFGGVLYRMDDFSLGPFKDCDILRCDEKGVIGRLVHRDGKLDVCKTPARRTHRLH